MYLHPKKQSGILKCLRCTGGSDCHMQNTFMLEAEGIFSIVARPGINERAAVLNSLKKAQNAQGSRRCFNLFLIISKKKLLKNDDDF